MRKISYKLKLDIAFVCKKLKFKTLSIRCHNHNNHLNPVTLYTISIIPNKNNETHTPHHPDGIEKIRWKAQLKYIYFNKTYEYSKVLTQ